MMHTPLARTIGVALALAALWALGIGLGRVPSWTHTSLHAQQAAAPQQAAEEKAASAEQQPAAASASDAENAQPAPASDAATAQPAAPDAPAAAEAQQPAAAESSAAPAAGKPDAMEASQTGSGAGGAMQGGASESSMQGGAMPAAAVSAEPPKPRGKIDWGQEFRTWDAVTGYVLSPSHGNRLVQTYIYPSEAAHIYKHNATLARQRKTEGYENYPPGTRIVQESWLRNSLGGPGEPGPVFFMRKEPPGYDSAAGDWRFAMTRDDLTLVGEGQESRMGFCKDCHARASMRDSVYASEH